ncbi:hypothetical protein DPMN_109779 [Dreissena polymorpha]|uniref:Uncharacterized protein n=1 Tax=Dreissena polymorpha TaxID=45954 RepID=A0A9D4KBE1_DREPO|nr:hypothetical protein DPMN_109779 [Dreissena polymorpha]
MIFRKKKTAPPPGGHVIQRGLTVFELIYPKFHEDLTINVTTREISSVTGGHTTALTGQPIIQYLYLTPTVRCIFNSNDYITSPTPPDRKTNSPHLVGGTLRPRFISGLRDVYFLCPLLLQGSRWAQILGRSDFSLDTDLGRNSDTRVCM